MISAVNCPPVLVKLTIGKVNVTHEILLATSFPSITAVLYSDVCDYLSTKLALINQGRKDLRVFLCLRPLPVAWS